MKKKMHKLLVIVCICIIIMTTFLQKNVYALISDVNFTLYSFEYSGTLKVEVDTDEKREAISVLKNCFGYTGNDIYSGIETMKFVTKIQITKKTTFGFYHIKIGNNEQAIELGTFTSIEDSYITKKDLAKKYGYPADKEPNVGDTWNVILFGTFSSEVLGGGNNEHFKGTVKATKLFSGDDYTQGEETNPNPGTEVDDREVTRGSEAVDDIKDVINGIKRFMESFLHNPPGTLVTLFCDVIINTLGDIFQTLANFFQTGFVIGNTVGETIKPKPIPVFTYDYLLANQGYNQYTNVSTEEPEGGYDGTNRIKIKNEGFGFTQDTKIPVAIVDFESLARNKVSNLDANFLIEDKNQTHSVLWRTIRNFVAVLIRIIIFLGMTILLTVLIINAIVIASSAITPIERAERIGGIHDFARALFMMVGTVVIMAIGIYSNLMIFNIADSAKNTNEIETNELPIRVYVEEAGYSFSTSTTGYVRYMASIDNVDMYGEKAIHSFCYLGMAILNLLFAVLMFARMIIMFGLAIIGPLIVIQYALQRMIPVNFIPINYQTWAIWYIAISAFQALMAIGYVIVKNAF